MVEVTLLDMYFLCAALLTLYATTAVGGNFPFKNWVRDARPDEMLIAFGFGERWRSERKVLVTAATKVMFALNVELIFSLRSAVLGFSKGAMPALWTRTSVTISSMLDHVGRQGDELSRRPYFFSTYSFVELTVISFVASSVTASSSASIPSFLSSTMVAGPEEAERQARMWVEVVLRRAVA